MKLEYLPNINPDYLGEDLIRLFDFDKQEAKIFQNIIRDRILRKRETVDLASLDFIKPVNCSLTRSLADHDKGIKRVTANEFDCQLTEKSYQQMLYLIEPFIHEDSEGFQWLYDLSFDVTSTEFLFTPTGKW